MWLKAPSGAPVALARAGTNEVSAPETAVDHGVFFCSRARAWRAPLAVVRREPGGTVGVCRRSVPPVAETFPGARLGVRADGASAAETAGGYYGLADRRILGRLWGVIISAAPPEGLSPSGA